jgi:hypothetical protein
MKTCEYKLIDSGTMGISFMEYFTECNEFIQQDKFSLRYIFCPFCGRKITGKSIAEVLKDE